jgi:hypothetical protein
VPETTTEPTRFPLCWPDTTPRSKHREAGQFKTALASAIHNVELSINKFGRMSGKSVNPVTISSNVTLGYAKPSDPGVAGWLKRDGHLVCIAVDRYSSVEANLQAIHHVLEARCTELRHGTLALVRQTMRGFQALPAPTSWRQMFGFAPDAVPTWDAVNTAYRDLAKLAGPESQKLIDLNLARDRAKQELSL